ncbi:hypothetical protein ACFOZY_03160 [Chungangia koreensis]|uniref:Uncharacterized protein n=1 Tax=Chungangia koreensis TaxID=752657 RepID=A0ABV8X5B5_9LACT
MKSVALINEKRYFVESEKVIQIVKERQEEVHRSLSTEQKLQIAKKSLEKASSREIFDSINNTIKDLEYEIKFGSDFIPAIPEEHQSKVAFNRVHEEEQIDLEIATQKELLLEIINGLEEPLMNVLTNIEKLEARKLIGKKIDILLDQKITIDPRIDNPFYHADGLAFSGEKSNSKEAREKGAKLFKALKKIATEPVKTNGLQKPSILQKMLGGIK